MLRFILGAAAGVAIVLIATNVTVRHAVKKTALDLWSKVSEQVKKTPETQTNENSSK